MTIRRPKEKGQKGNKTYKTLQYTQNNNNKQQLKIEQHKLQTKPRLNPRVHEALTFTALLVTLVVLLFNDITSCYMEIALDTSIRR